jgi:predicted nucleotidyltransferase
MDFTRDWNDFLRENRKFIDSIGGDDIEKELSTYLDHGPNKEGGYENKRAHFGGKKYTDISATPALEEEVEIETFEMRNELQPEVWRDNEMWPEVRERLMEIVDDFLDGLDVEVGIEDVRLTGSLANYNWSKYSDVDLHIVVDFAEIDEDTELVKSFFDAARARWNDLHAIDIYGFEVEIYIENMGDPHHSTGIYSVMNGEWVIEPDPREVEIDFALARKKSDNVESRVNLINHMISAGKLAASLKSIERTKLKIRRMRQAGLTSPQKEFSPENIAFKILRRDGTLDRLSQMRYTAYDRHMSLSEKKK